MYVNTTDRKNEIMAIRNVAGKIPELVGSTVRQNKEDSAIYDFSAFRKIEDRVPTIRTDKEYQDIKREGEYIYLDQSDMKWIDENVFATIEKKAACIDVKVRDSHLKDYPTCLISLEKVQHLSVCKLMHYAVFCFAKDKTIRVFNLANRVFTEKMLTFYHKRAEKEITQPVYLFNNDSYVCEVKYE